MEKVVDVTTAYPVQMDSCMLAELLSELYMVWIRKEGIRELRKEELIQSLREILRRSVFWSGRCG